MAKVSTDIKRVNARHDKSPFIQLTYELINSAAWRGMSSSCRKLIDFLMLEHMSHQGKENGNLIATYNQLEGFGIPRRNICGAIEEAEQLRLILVEHGMRKDLRSNYVNRYTLTFVKTKHTNPSGIVYYAEPSHDWRGVTDGVVMRVSGKTPKRLNADFDVTKVHC